MTKAPPPDLALQLADAHATIEVLRQSVHEEHAGAAQAYQKLADERKRRCSLELLLLEAAMLMKNSAATWPGKQRLLLQRIDAALKPHVDGPPS